MFCTKGRRTSFGRASWLSGNQTDVLEILKPEFLCGVFLEKKSLRKSCAYRLLETKGKFFQERQASWNYTDNTI